MRELSTILSEHKKWLSGEGRQKANLRGADLRWADLSGADLRGADLRWADLRWADLSGADLSGADLRWADLRWADLSGADLSGADLSGANLSGANLRWADLRGADLDFSALPLWCGSLSANFDDKHIVQIIYHAVKAGTQSINTSPELKVELEGFIDVANRFHRVEECGRIAKEGVTNE